MEHKIISSILKIKKINSLLEMGCDKVLSSIVIKLTHLGFPMTIENCEMLEYHTDFSVRVVLLTHETPFCRETSGLESYTLYITRNINVK